MIISKKARSHRQISLDVKDMEVIGISHDSHKLLPQTPTPIKDSSEHAPIHKVGQVPEHQNNDIPESEPSTHIAPGKISSKSPVRLSSQQPSPSINPKQAAEDLNVTAKQFQTDTSSQPLDTLAQ